MRKIMRTGMKSNGSSVITPKTTRISGKPLMGVFAPVLAGSLVVFADVGVPPVPELVPLPWVLGSVLVGVIPLVGDAPGETATVGDDVTPAGKVDVGDGKVPCVALGEGTGVFVGRGVLVGGVGSG